MLVKFVKLSGRVWLNWLQLQFLLQFLAFPDVPVPRGLQTI